MIKDNKCYNTPTLESIYNLTKYGYTKSQLKMYFEAFKEDTYYYFYEDNLRKPYFISGKRAGEIGLIKTFLHPKPITIE